MKGKTREGRFAYEGLDRTIHERARLSLLTSLITNPKDFSRSMTSRSSARSLMAT